MKPMSAMSKFPISALPIASPSQLLIHRLNPDTHTPSPFTFRTNVLTTSPSLQRRARVREYPSTYHFEVISANSDISFSPRLATSHMSPHSPLPSPTTLSLRLALIQPRKTRARTLKNGWPTAKQFIPAHQTLIIPTPRSGNTSQITETSPWSSSACQKRV